MSARENWRSNGEATPFRELNSQMPFPKKYTADEAPTAVLKLIERLVPSLIDGDHPALASLRTQFEVARIKEVELTGVGFYVEFEVPPDVPLAKPADFAGGDASIALEGAIHGAGCILFVRDGRLAMLEGYTYGDAWPEDAQLFAIEGVTPIDPNGGG